MKYIAQILLLLLPVCSYSQQQTIDSLKRLLPRVTTDSARFKLLYQIGHDYYATNYDSGLIYAEKSLLVAQKNGKKLNEAEALSLKGFLLTRLQRLTQSYQALTAALQIAENPPTKNNFWNIKKPQIKDKDYHLSVLRLIHNALGIFMSIADRTDQAIWHYNKAIEISNAIGDSSGAAMNAVHLGGVYRLLNLPDSALQMARTAEALLFQKNDEKLLAPFYFVIGASFNEKHNDSLALVYLYKAIAICKKYSMQDNLARNYRWLANFYVKENNKDSSLYSSRMGCNPPYPNISNGPWG
jgi:tetratricopeptide (TPR) repeat protein